LDRGGGIGRVAPPMLGATPEARLRILSAPEGVFVFHAFAKKTQRTPPLEIELARKRLKELRHA